MKREADGRLTEESLGDVRFVPLVGSAVFHASEVPAFFLPLREPARRELRDELTSPRLERAIGVVYRPQTELRSHYFHAILSRQFDEYVWFDAPGPVRPVTEEEMHRLPRAHPFAAGTRT